MNSTSTLSFDLNLVQVSGVVGVQLQCDAASPLNGDAPLHHIHRGHHPRGRRGIHDEGAGPLTLDGCPLVLLSAEEVLNPLLNIICSLTIVLPPNPLSSINRLTGPMISGVKDTQTLDHPILGPLYGYLNMRGSS